MGALPASFAHFADWDFIMVGSARILAAKDNTGNPVGAAATGPYVLRGDRSGAARGFCYHTPLQKPG